MSHQATDHLKARMQTAQKVAVLTGAGISAESGVPTFRGPDGLWRNFRAEVLATPISRWMDVVLLGPAAQVLPELSA